MFAVELIQYNVTYIVAGPFLNSIWGKLQTFTSNCLYVNLHLTGVITRLTWYPLPILQSILLRTDIATTSDTPSFYQVIIERGFRPCSIISHLWTIVFPVLSNCLCESFS